MAILYDKSGQRITIHTRTTTYQMGIGPYGHLLHYYYGKRAEGDFSACLSYRDRGFAGNPYDAGNDRTYSLDILPQEFPCYGNGDYRTTSFRLKQENGVYGCDLRVKEVRVEAGLYTIPELPTVYAGTKEAEGAETLSVILEDAAANVEVTLRYGVLPELDVILRANTVRNIGKHEIVVEKMDSASVDMLHGDFEMIHFSGRYGTERLMQRTRLGEGRFTVGSLRGESSHQHNPFAMLCAAGAGEDHGLVMAAGLLYSGNFTISAELDQMGQTRFALGVSDEMFAWPLAAGESFTTPQAVLCIGEGFASVTHRFHDLVNHHIVREKQPGALRPILLNSWEGCYFDFDGEKIIALAEEAAELGMDLLVMDDGWFGKRDDDCSGLGDWKANEKKLGMPLKELGRRIHEKGVKFGIWIEPEMVNEDSDLYRAHPDYAFVIPGRKPIRSRYQLCLDFSRKEVVDCIADRIISEFRDVPLDYIKMDMNRSVHDVFTHAPEWADRQNVGRTLYRYVLGVYAFIERLHEAFPDVLIEGCSGGGGRFDLGMLYYTPQIWLSDNTDAIERLQLQYGSSFIYPVSTIGAHVSAVPNHQTGRVTPLVTRAVTAMAGTFGYELDPARLSAEEKTMIRKQIQRVKQFWNLTHDGLYDRLSAPEGEWNPADGTHDPDYMAWQYTARDRSEALASVVFIKTHCNAPTLYLKWKELDPDATYRLHLEDQNRELPEAWQLPEELPAMTGAVLMEMGMPLPYQPGEYNSLLIYAEKAKDGQG